MMRLSELWHRTHLPMKIGRMSCRYVGIPGALTAGVEVLEPAALGEEDGDAAAGWAPPRFNSENRGKRMPQSQALQFGDFIITQSRCEGSESVGQLKQEQVMVGSRVVAVNEFVVPLKQQGV